MHDSDGNEDKGGTRLLQYAQSKNLAELKNNERQMSTHDFIVNHAKDSYCGQATSTIGVLGPAYHYDRYGLLWRVFPIEDAVQTDFPNSLRARLLYHSHYPCLAGQPGEERMFDIVRREYYWTHMGNELYTTVKDCFKMHTKYASGYKPTLSTIISRE